MIYHDYKCILIIFCDTDTLKQAAFKEEIISPSNTVNDPMFFAQEVKV